MGAVFWGWGIVGGILVLMAAALGVWIGRGYLGILIDTRGRYSLTQLQIVLWSMTLLSLFAGLFIGRLVHHAAGGALGFKIPAQLLQVMGISLASMAGAIVVKSEKDRRRGESVAASALGDAQLSQVFTVEEGGLAGKVIDVTKIQNFWITILLIVGYISLAVAAILHARAPATIILPTFSGTYVTLLFISHAGYLAGKVPSREGTPEGETIQNLSGRRPLRHGQPDPPR